MAVGAKRSHIPAKRLLFGIPFHIIDNEEIQPPVVVIVEPPGAYGPHPAVCNACLRGCVLEGSIAAVAIQNIAVHSYDVEIGKSVVVEITGGYSHIETCSTYARPVRNIFELPIAQIAVEPIEKWRAGFLKRRLLRSIGKEQIGASVVIE